MEITRTTTRLVVTVEELDALQQHQMREALPDLVQRALGPGADGAAPQVQVEPAPTPANRLLPEAGGKPLVRCPKCGNQIVYYNLSRHMGSAMCLRNSKRQRQISARRR